MILSENFGDVQEQCVEDLDRDDCLLTSSQLGVVDAIAAIRMITASLSFMGAVSIILLSIVKKQVFSSKVHPIFVLSVADLLLSLLWIIGGGAWLRKLDNRVWCYAISLPTIILECITVNLTIVYALLAYSSIKKKDLNNLLRNDKNDVMSDQVWHPAWTATAYIIAWLLPTVLVMIQFGALAGTSNLVSDANKCSCWCLPIYGNVLPLAGLKDNTTITTTVVLQNSCLFQHCDGQVLVYFVPSLLWVCSWTCHPIHTRKNQATRHFVYDVNILIATYGLTLGTNYLVGFILLVVIYTKLLRYIKKIRTEFEQARSPTRQYGATGMLIITGQSKAKKRVIAFLTVFVMTGVLNFILSYMYLIVETIVLPGEPNNFFLSPTIVAVFNVILGLQSFLVPLQGFLNAIVYGWTREDFAQLMAIGRSHFDGWDLDGSEEETDAAPAVIEESDAHSMHSNLRVRCGSRHEVEDSVAPDETDGSS